MLGQDEGAAREEVTRLITAARECFAARQFHKTVDALHAAQAAATGGGLHREAAEIKRALSIVANGGRPKMLTRLQKPGK